MAKKPPDLSYINQGLHTLAVEIDTVQPDPDNPREGHDLEGLKASLKLFGQRSTLVANRSNGNKLLKGNGVWQAAKALGWQYIAVVFVEDDPDTATGYRIADDRLSDSSHFNFDVVAALLKVLPQGTPLPGFDPDVVASILQAQAEREADQVDPSEGTPSADEDPAATEVVLRFQVPPGTYDLWEQWWSLTLGDTDDQKLTQVLNAVDRQALAVYAKLGGAP